MFAGNGILSDGEDGYERIQKGFDGNFSCHFSIFPLSINTFWLILKTHSFHPQNARL